MLKKVTDTRCFLSRKTASMGTILVADDNVANLELLSGLLEVEGYEVLSVVDGEQALQTLRSKRIDLLLLDVRMPKRNGFELCRLVKSHPDTRLIPVVIVTASTAGADRIAGIESGADDFLSKPVNREELRARVRSLLRMKQFTDDLESAETVLFSLALSIEAKDPYTEGHCDRLSKYSVALAEQLNLSDELRIALRRAGTVHDIGKVAVPEHILLKPGPLTQDEWEIMRQHPVVGERICAPLRSFRHVLPVIRYHHEKLDGSGYPDGLKGEEIPLTARVLQTVDIYDALTTSRPYRKALSPEEAFTLMHKEVERGWWDGALVDELEALILGSFSPDKGVVLADATRGI
jgi:putative two-component system response regulator